MQSHFVSRHPPELTKKYPFINSTLSTTDAFTTSPAALTHWRSHQLEQREFISGWDPALLVPDLLILEPGEGRGRQHTTWCTLSYCFSSLCCQGTSPELSWSCLKVPFWRRSRVPISSLGGEIHRIHRRGFCVCVWGGTGRKGRVQCRLQWGKDSRKKHQRLRSG